MPTKDVWSGNIGEWGEVFVLLQLLAHNKLHNADMHGQRIDDEYSLVEAMLRTETSGIELVMEVDGDYIIDHIGTGNTIYVPKAEFAEKAHSLFRRMVSQSGNAKHPEQEFLKSLGLEGVKASSSVKADIAARLYESYLATHLRRDFSIKCVVGGKPSMANASAQSYIDYLLPGFDEWKKDEVMSIGGRSWAVDRIRRVLDLVDGYPIPTVRNKIFNRNLLKCHWKAPEAVGLGLLYGQLERGKPVIDSIATLKDVNPAGYDEDELDDYEDAIRGYLRGIVSDLVPASPWRGPSQIDGYLLVTDNEEVLAYQISRQRSFEDYLLLHTCWDTPSTRRYPDVGVVRRRSDGAWVFSLSCVVRYNAREYTGKNSVRAGIRPT
jgi:hypothetical protein